MSGHIVTDSDRAWAEAFVNSCRYVAEQRGEPFNEAAVTASIREALTVPRPRHPHDDFEPVEPDMSDYGHEGADRAEARETRWLAGES